MSGTGTGTKDLRVPALRRFALAITVLNLLGHTVLGFEQSWASPLVALPTAYACELLLEAIVAWQQRRRPRFLAAGDATARQRTVCMADFLLSPHITAMAVSMLLYPGERLWPVVFGTGVAIASKYIFRVTSPNGASR